MFDMRENSGRSSSEFIHYFNRIILFRAFTSIHLRLGGSNESDKLFDSRCNISDSRSMSCFAKSETLVRNCLASKGSCCNFRDFEQQWNESLTHENRLADNIAYSTGCSREAFVRNRYKYFMCIVYNVDTSVEFLAAQSRSKCTPKINRHIGEALDTLADIDRMMQ